MGVSRKLHDRIEGLPRAVRGGVTSLGKGNCGCASGYRHLVEAGPSGRSRTGSVRGGLRRGYRDAAGRQGRRRAACRRPWAGSLFIDAQAFTNVPSNREVLRTRKAGATSRWARIAAIHPPPPPPPPPPFARRLGGHKPVTVLGEDRLDPDTDRRSPAPRNQRNKRLSCICSIRCRSERTGEQDLDQARPDQPRSFYSKNGAGIRGAPEVRVEPAANPPIAARQRPRSPPAGSCAS